MNGEQNLPLSGKTIVITRAKDQQSEARTLFERYGAKVFDLPSLDIVPPDDWTPLDEALRELHNFHWIVFSSVNGVLAVEERLKLIGSSLADKPTGLKIAVVGRKTARSLQELNVVPDFIPPEYVADSLMQNFPVSGLGLKILIPRVQTGGRTVLAEGFLQAGASITEVPAYESLCPSDIPKSTYIALNNFKVDAIVFTSGKTAIHSARLIRSVFADKFHKVLAGVKLISIGPQTSISCRKSFNRCDEEASPHDLDGLLQACIDSIGIL